MIRDLRRQLIEGDPIAREGGLEAGDVHVIRQRVLEAHGWAPTPRAWWLAPLALAGAVAACLMLAITIGTRLGRDESTGSNVRGAVPMERSRRQMQFATPGGTRIIWTFHQEFHL